MELKHEIRCPFISHSNMSKKTCSEIIREARQSLRVQSTQRPFTPKESHRQLFGANSVRAGHDNRPSSTFSVCARNFDASNSRPASGNRLPPLNHKPTFPVPSVAETVPKPPLEARRGLAGARVAVLKAGAVPTLQPLQTHKKNDKSRLNSGSDPKPLPARCTTPHRGPVIPGTHRPASDSSKTVQPVGDKTTEQSHHKTGLKDGNSSTEDADALMFKNKVILLLQELESEAAGSSTASLTHLCELCERLHGTLSEARMLGRHCKRRSEILRILFRLIDLRSAQLSLHIAKLCLALSVSGNNLLNICKLIYKISRSESNDILFRHTSIIELLLGVLNTEDVCLSGEALLYCVATFKFLSGNTSVLKVLLDQNFVAVVQTLIYKLCKAEEVNLTTAGHILVQLTATLRNLADHPEARTLFISISILPTLCLVLSLHWDDQDVCTNISRIFSKLSSYSECCLALAQIPESYPTTLEVLSKHPQKQDLVVRLLFTLGNLTAKSSESRQQLYECDGCMDTVMQLYNIYQRRDQLAPQKDPDAPSISVKEADDVLVKLVRLLANMSIHPAVGPLLAANTACIHLLMETLELRSMQESEELLVKVAATINNLSFYLEESSEIRCNHLTTAKLMLKLMLSSSMDATLEATRIFGNLSHHKDVRDFIMQNKVHRFVVTLLDSRSAEMCFSACGVLTNLALDPLNRVRLASEGALAKLVDCLGDFGPCDWQLAGQACRAVWNLTAGGSEELLDTQEREMLLRILTTYLDKGGLEKIEKEVKMEPHSACWELEFLPIAEELMKALQGPDLTAEHTPCF
uniref:Armadillo repeat containing 2 n=1 Tax=Oryzias latipes TaxID=8090 RepID=A0A3P9M733_ORYLA